MNGSRGFTLIELMVVVVLLSITASIAIPSFTQLINNNRTQSLNNEMLSLIQFARSSAVQQRTQIKVCKESNRWTIRSACNSTSEVLRIVEIPEQAQVNSDTSELTFRHNGTASAAANITICHNNNADNGYTISVRSSGSIRKGARGQTADNKPMTCS